MEVRQIVVCVITLKGEKNPHFLLSMHKRALQESTVLSRNCIAKYSSFLVTGKEYYLLFACEEISYQSKLQNFIKSYRDQTSRF